MEYWSQRWHARLCILTYLGIQAGLGTGKAAAVTLMKPIAGAVKKVGGSGDSSKAGEDDSVPSKGAAGSSSDPAPAEPAKSLKQCKEELQRLRNRCKNTLHLTMLLSMDATLLKNCRILWLTSRPLNRWYEEQAHKLRSRGAGLEFRVDQAVGKELLRCLHETASFWSDLSALSHVGFIVEEAVCNPKYKKMDMQDPGVSCEDGLANTVQRQIFNLLKQRLRSVGSECFGCPGKLAALLHPDPDVVKRVLADMKDAHESMQKGALSPLPFWKACTRQSVMQFTLVKDC